MADLALQLAVPVGKVEVRLNAMVFLPVKIGIQKNKKKRKKQNNKLNALVLQLLIFTIPHCSLD